VKLLNHIWPWSRFALYEQAISALKRDGEQTRIHLKKMATIIALKGGFPKK